MFLKFGYGKADDFLSQQTRSEYVFTFAFRGKQFQKRFGILLKILKFLDEKLVKAEISFLRDSYQGFISPPPPTIGLENATFCYRPAPASFHRYGSLAVARGASGG